MGKLFKMSLVLILLFLTPINASAAFKNREHVTYPCSVVLNPVQLLLNARGVALITEVRRQYTNSPNSPWRERESISIHADWLPSPSTFGQYDAYEGFAQVPGEISWRFQLYPINNPDSFLKGATWVGNIYDISYGLPSNTQVQVRLSNSKTKKLGPVVLENSLKNCR